MKIFIRIAAMLLCAGHVAAASAETISYVYDAKGRLVRIVKENSTYTRVDSTIRYDKANNRQRVTTVASPR